MATLMDNIAVYDELQDALEAEHLMEWVLVYNKEIIGFYDDFQKVAETAVRRFGRGPYLIRQVGAPPRRISPFYVAG